MNGGRRADCASSANPAAPIKAPHSVVTQHLIDREGQPTRAAVDEIIALFVERLVANAHPP